MRALVSLHDVTPHHQHRLDRAEAFFTRLGIAHVSYLLVPNFHDAAPIAGDATFRAWCRRPRPFAVSWILHGYSHREGPVVGERVGSATWWKRRALTAGEGEFLGLSAADAADRVHRGCHAFEDCLGARPVAFVAPAWLFNRALFSVLVDSGIHSTEDHRFVHDVSRGIAHDCPVITWATRSVAHRAASRVACDVLARRWRHQPLLRIAVHPHDFDHSSVVAQIGRVLTAVVETRQCVDHARLGA